MDLSRPSRLVAAIALCTGLNVSALAQDDCSGTPIALGDKPVMSAYADYSDFLVAVMEHKTREEDRRRHQKLCPELYREAPAVSATPQTLEGVIRESAQKTPFDYSQHRSWYNRSTSRSFGLPGLPNATMSGEAIHTSLLPLEQGSLDERLRTILLAGLSPLGKSGLDDGSAAASLVNRQVSSDTLLRRETDVLSAFDVGSFGSQLAAILYVSGGPGWVTFYMSENDIIKIESSAETEFSGSFGLTIATP